MISLGLDHRPRFSRRGREFARFYFGIDTLFLDLPTKKKRRVLGLRLSWEKCRFGSCGCNEE